MKQHFLLGLFIIAFLGFLWSCTDVPNTKEQPSNDTSSNSIYLEKGKQIAAISFATLSQRLQKAIQEGGIPNAIQYCNLAAYPLTDSLSTAHSVIIRRTSLKERNPANKPIRIFDPI